MNPRDVDLEALGQLVGPAPQHARRIALALSSPGNGLRISAPVS